MASALLRDCPEIETAVRLETANLNVRQGGEIIPAADFYFSEPAVFSVFSFSFLEGSATTALSTPNSIVLTRNAANLYLGPGPAIGHTLLLSGTLYHVTAVQRTMVIYNQMQFIAHKNLGADREGIVTINIPTDSAVRVSTPAFVQTLRHESGIHDISVGSGLPAEGIQLAAGRNFSDSLRTDKQESFIVNQAFVKKHGLEDRPRRDPGRWR